MPKRFGRMNSSVPTTLINCDKHMVGKVKFLTTLW